MKSTKVMLRAAIVVTIAAAMSMTVVAQKGKPAAGGPTAIKVDGNIIKGYIAWLADPQREGRKTLTPGYEKSVEWVAAKFKEWGLKPAGDNGTYLQDVPITGARSSFAWTTGIPELIVDGRTFLLKDGDFTLDTASTPGTQASGEIVFVGYGISAPSKGLDEYAGVDVKGKIVVALKGSPQDAPAARVSFGPAQAPSQSTEAWTTESADQAKILNAYNKGAAAIMLFSPERLAAASGRGSGPQAAPPAAGAGGFARPAPLDPAAFTRPFLAVTDIDARIFRQVMYRDPVQLQESSRGWVARVDQFRRDIREKKTHSFATGVRGQVKGYSTTTWYGEKWKNNVSHNVIGKVEGTDPKLKAQYIVVGGHLDHLGVTNGIVMNGADDDASGAATVMEMARLVAANAASIKPKRTIIFAAWCGEEEGLLGSNWWGEHPTDGVKMDNVVADFNNDMVGLGDHVGAPGGLNFPSIWQVIMRNQAPDVASVVQTSTAGPGGSDYSTFIEKGIESIALMTAGGVGHPDYHDAGDDVEKIDPEILRKNGQFVLQGVINVANETSVELLVPDRQHLYNAMRMTLFNLNEDAAGGRGGRGGQVAAPGPVTPRLRVALSEPAAFNGNLALVDVAANMMGVGRVDVPARGDGVWFGPGGLTDAGRTALKAIEANGITVNLVNPGAALLSGMLEAAARPFLVSSLATLPDAATVRRIKAKNALVAVDFDVAAPQALAARLIEFKKIAGDSGNLLLITRDTPATAGRGEAPPATDWKTSRLDEAKQQFYLALIKAGWTKDEIYAMVGVSPAGGGRGGGAAALGGNLARLNLRTPTT